MKKNLFSISVLSLVLLSCGESNTGESQKQSERGGDSTLMTASLPDKQSFAGNINGKATDLYVLKNKAGMTLAITNYGGRFVSLLVPDKDGKLRDVVVGFKSVNDFVSSSEPYFGATIGRYGNRIAGGKFTLDGKEYSLSVNNGPNTLHGARPDFSR